jgi:simple sugar transport system ATP-binding protein
MTAPRVAMRGIVKRFGDTVALRSVDFTAARGEIHGLLGENGAGKTTLMNVLSGLYRADAGEIAIDGVLVAVRSPAHALRHGIGMVHQHVELIDSFTALENIVLGREGSRVRLRIDAHRAAVDAVIERFGLRVDLDTPVRRLAIGVQQKVEILKALYRGVEVLILDEPTTMLTPQEVDVLFATIRTMAQQGVAVVFITHKILEVLANCDRFTVMRGGSVVGTLPRASADEAGLVELMIGQHVARARAEAPAVATTGDVLEVRALAVAGPRGASAVAECSFALRGGEVAGLAGVAGNGQRELAEALIGVRPATRGRIMLGGRDVTRAAVRDRLAAGLAYIPEDRIEDGLLPGLTLAENLVLGLHHCAFPRRARFDSAVARRLAREAITDYGVQARDEQASAASLSGGNIQKLLVARAMALAHMAHGLAVVAMNPTRGLDVRATELVRARLLAFARAGGGVLVVSEDLDELLEVCDRILVVFRGAIVGNFARSDFDPYRIGALMTGAATEPVAP